MDDIEVLLSSLEPNWKAAVGDIELHVDDVRSLGFCRSPIGYLNDKVIDALVYAFLQQNIPESFLVEDISLVLISSLMTSNFEGALLEDRVKFLRGRSKKIDDATKRYIESPPSVDLRKDNVLLIPTHVNGNHWVATILYYRHQQGVMHEFIVKSLYSGESSSASTNSVVKDIFLAYRVKYFANINIDWKQYNIKCTQQTTGYDCGLFTIGE